MDCTHYPATSFHVLLIEGFLHGEEFDYTPGIGMWSAGYSLHELSPLERGDVSRIQRVPIRALAQTLGLETIFPVRFNAEPIIGDDDVNWLNLLWKLNGNLAVTTKNVLGATNPVFAT